MYMWARDRPVTDTMDEAEVDSRTAVDAYQWFREVCTTRLLAAPIILGGPGVVVQIDESLFRHKPKVSRLNYRYTETYHLQFGGKVTSCIY